MSADLDFNAYHLKYITSGGFASIYSAVPKLSGKPHLTLKVLIKSFLRTEAQLNRFENELSILKKVQHPSLPELTHYGSVDGLPYLAYKHIKGQTVLDLLQNCTESGESIEHLAKQMMKQLLETLDYLHCLSEPIVHSDLSPENLIIDQQNTLSLIDFGCAHVVDNNQTSVSKWIGKPSYLSPEQAQGVNWDHRSDLYQAGIVFYELLTRKKKNLGSNERLARTIAANPPFIDFAGIPPYLYDFLAKLLHIDPEQRWQSARECNCALRIFV